MAAFLDIAARMFAVLEQNGVRLDPAVKADAVEVIRREYPGERAYIVPLMSRKDPARAEAIRQAAARLPTGVVSERLGVSRQLIHYHTKKR